MFMDAIDAPVAARGIGNLNHHGINFNKPEEITNAIYANYDRLNTSVYRTIEVSAGIIWDTYARWLEFKGTDPVKYASEIKAHQDEITKNNPLHALWGHDKYIITESVSKEIKEFRENPEKADEPVDEEYYIKPESSFKYFCRSFLVNDKLFGDPQCVLNYEGYLRSVSLLRSELNKNDAEKLLNDDISIKFDIENTPEFAELNIHPWCENFISFKIKPIIKSGDKFLTGLSDLNVIDCDYVVNLDIRNLIFFIIQNAKEVSFFKDKESYISYITNTFGGLPERITRRICLELYCVATESTTGFSKFLQKLAITSKKISKSERFEHLENLICGFKHMKDNHILSDNVENFTNDKNISLINDILNEFVGEPGYQYIFDSTQFPGNLLNASGNSEDISDMKKKMIATFIGKAFTVYFESAVALDYYKEYVKKESDYIMYNFYLNKIYREFDRKYDFTSLNQSISKISDYNKRDFIKNIINEIQNVNVWPYDDRKMPNGEKYSYMYCKNKRCVWLAITVGFAKLFDLKTTFNDVVESRKYQMSTGEQKLSRSIERSFINLFASYIRNLSLIGNKIGVPLTKKVGYSDYYDYSDIAYLVTQLSKYTTNERLPYTNGHHEQHKRIKTFIENKSSNEMKYCDTNMVMSFDPNDLSDDTSKSTTKLTNTLINNTLRKNLVESGMIDVEFLPFSD